MNVSYETKYNADITKQTEDMHGQSLMSDSTRQIYEIVNLIVIVQFISTFGIISNVITIVVFYKQGYYSAVNISFTGLAVSDLCSLVASQWYVICFNPLFIRSGIPMVTAEVQHLTSGVPHLCFSRITGWITAYITFERCLCIHAPLTVKVLLTPKRSAVIIVLIYLVTIASLAPEYLSLYIDWKFYPHTNQTLLGLVHTSNTSSLNGLTFLLYALHMLIAFAAVVTLTAMLVFKLKRVTLWRKGLSNADKLGSISSRDRKSVSMAVVVAVAMLVFFTPSILITVASFLVSDFNIDGRFSNLFLVIWSFGLIFEVTNSSLCLVLYYITSSKFRKSLYHLFSNCSLLINLFEVAADAVNLIVFIKQGWDNTINVTLAALAIYDLCVGNAMCRAGSEDLTVSRRPSYQPEFSLTADTYLLSDHRGYNMLVLCSRFLCVWSIQECILLPLVIRRGL
ncbi:hypothetical protein Btru_065494 [Bulinus truncatus]|nr:hypothetical protein Btru_065494 [Bulinus truncatus]